MSDNEYRRFEHLRSRVYQPLINEIKIDEDLIKGDYAKDIIPDEWMDEGLQPTVPPTAYNAITNAADHILTSPRTFVPARPVNQSVEASREVAEKQRQFHDMWWARVHEEQGDPLKRAVRKLMLGKMVLKKTLDLSLIPDLPDDPDTADKRRFRRALEKVARSKFLWNLEVIPPESVFEDPSEPWNPAYVYEIATVEVGNLLRKYPDLEGEYGQGDLTREVEYVEMWTRPEGDYAGEFVVWVEGSRVHEAENPYSWESAASTDDHVIYDGYVPYAISDPGFGDVNSESKPEDRYTSLLKPIRSVLISEARYLTEMEAWLRMYVFPALVTVNMNELEDGEKEFRLGPGTHMNIRPDQQLDLLRWGEAPVTLMQGLQRVNNYADEASKFTAMGGTPMVGVDTATEADQLFRSAATKLGGPISALQRVCQRINAWVLMDIEHVLSAPVTLYGAFEYAPSEITLAPREVNGYYYNNVVFETSDASVLNSRKARLWGDLFRIMPGLSERTALEKMGITDPTQEQEERAVEDMLRSSPIQQATLLMALAGLGEPGELVRMAFEQNLGGTNQRQQPQMGDQNALTTVDEIGNPVAPVIDEARAQAMQQAPERQLF
jgi:hypothetical protein|tara:strand:+ start:1951 stop:3774 length:1824 start_codon:yes stop_codon:yes gene_type:complete